MPVVEPFRVARTEKPCEIFSVPATLASGKVVDEAWLDQVISNWETLQAGNEIGYPTPPVYIVPSPSVTVGHEEFSSIAQSYANRTDLPAVGWISDLYRQGNKLVCNFREVPETLAQWINTGAYRDISSEFYEDFDGHGPVLRRVSLLGAEIPQRKDLAKIPTMVYEASQEQGQNPLAFCESGLRKNKVIQVAFGNHCVRFSEKGNSSMNRAETIKALQALGVDTSLFTEAVPDEALNSMLTSLQQKDAKLVAKQQELTAKDQELATKNSQGSGQDYGNAFTEVNNKLNALAETVKKMTEGNTPPATPTPKPDTNADANRLAEEVKKMTETVLKQAEEETKKAADAFNENFKAEQKKNQERMAELTKQAEDKVKAMTAQIEESKRQADNRIAEEKAKAERAELEAFLSRYSDRIKPSENDPACGMPLIEKLLAADNTKVLHKFSENGKEVVQTLRQALMAEIASRSTLRKFGEKMVADEKAPSKMSREAVEAALSVSPLGKGIVRAGGHLKNQG